MLKTSSDKTLIEAVIAGDTTAFEQLYDHYAGLVRAVCYDEMGNLTDAQDLAQEVFLLAYEKLGQLRTPELFGRWLIGITRFKCRQWRRKNSRSTNAQIRLDDTYEVPAGHSNNGRLEKLREKIAELPEKERLILHTFYLQENSAEDARRIFGLSRSGFYRVLERARQQLAELLSKER